MIANDKEIRAVPRRVNGVTVWIGSIGQLSKPFYGYGWQNVRSLVDTARTYRHRSSAYRAACKLAVEV